MSPDAVRLLDGPSQVWDCLANGAFELRAETGKLLETTPYQPRSARVTLYQWAGCTPDEEC